MPPSSRAYLTARTCARQPAPPPRTPAFSDTGNAHGHSCKALGLPRPTLHAPSSFRVGALRSGQPCYGTRRGACSARACVSGGHCRPCSYLSPPPPPLQISPPHPPHFEGNSSVARALQGGCNPVACNCNSQCNGYPCRPHAGSVISGNICRTSDTGCAGCNMGSYTCCQTSSSGCYFLFTYPCYGKVC